MYIQRSDQPGMRGPMGPHDAQTNIGAWQHSAPKDAELRILRDDFTILHAYRYTMGDDGHEAWHLQDC